MAPKGCKGMVPLPGKLLLWIEHRDCFPVHVLSLVDGPDKLKQGTGRLMSSISQDEALETKVQSLGLA